MGNYLNGIKVGAWLYKRFGIKFAEIHYDNHGDIISHYKFYSNSDTSFEMKRFVQDQDTFDVEKTYDSSGKIFDSKTIVHHADYDTMYYTNGNVKLIFEEKKKNFNVSRR